MSLSTFLAALPLLLIINASGASLAAYCVVASVGGCVASLNGPNVRQVLQGVISPEMRGSAFALFTVSDDLGRALGPSLSLALINRFGRQDAFNADLAGWALCGALLLVLSGFYEADMAAAQERVRGALRQRRYIRRGHAIREGSDSLISYIMPNYLLYSSLVYRYKFSKIRTV